MNKQSQGLMIKALDERESGAQYEAGKRKRLQTVCKLSSALSDEQLARLSEAAWWTTRRV